VKLLLDTSTFLWIVDAPEHLSPRVAELFQSAENDVFLSAVSAWEIATKCATGKMTLSEPAEHYVPKQRQAHRIRPLPIDEESALRAATLPWLHKDPWDRILVAQAVVHGLTIVTPDRLIAQYAVRTIW